MLDAPSKYMRRELTNVLEAVLEFRKIVKKYLLGSDVDSEDSDVPMETPSELNAKKVAMEEGLGLLKVHAPNFSQVRTECSSDLKRLQKKYKATMIVTMNTLKKSQHKAGETSFWREAYVKLNFNCFYLNDDE